MDLRAIINSDGPEPASSRPHAKPVTPIHTNIPPALRDYPPPPTLRGRPSYPEYASHGPAPFASPTTYDGAGYIGRQPPAPPQALAQHDSRSSAASPYPAQSPCRNSSSSSASHSQYPFPQTNKPPQSPAQQQLQYPSQYSPRVGHSHSLQYPTTYSQLSPAPQTPPIGNAASAHSYSQYQRSLSSVSSTPTSTHSQPSNPSQHIQDNSPVITHQAAPQTSIRQRKQSQPGTPLGPPLQGQRQFSVNPPQANSPLQQRALQAVVPQFRTSPAQLPVSSYPARSSNTASDYASNRSSSHDALLPCTNERDRNLSVSPKTRSIYQSVDNMSESKGQNPSTRRKIADREQAVEKQQDTRDVPGNNRSPKHPPLSAQITSSSPQQPRKKRIRFTEPPVWARSAKDPNLNWKKPVDTANVSPTPTKTNGHRHESLAPNPVVEVVEESLLGPWEQSILGAKPYDDLTRVIADWLYLKVVNRNDLGELSTHKVEVEVEAKLGQLIDTATNHRYQLPVQSECILGVRPGDIQFTSSMTEVQHKHLNKFLNDKVVETHPNNPKAKNRVQVEHKHRRELDQFYELPEGLVKSIPAAVRAYMNPRHTPKVRVTHDQKTHEILAKIVKVTVENIHIYMPRSNLDCRISVNFELPYDGDIDLLPLPADTSESPNRRKDRLSYTQSHYQIDLTQVTQTTVVKKVPREVKDHELEIEVSAAALQGQGNRARTGQPNDYIKLVEGFIDNVRVLAREVTLA